MNIIESEIPSDNESIDGLVESENENYNLNDLMDNTQPDTDSDNDCESDRIHNKNYGGWRRCGLSTYGLRRQS